MAADPMEWALPLQQIADAADALRPLTAEAQRALDGELGWWGTYVKTVEDGLLGLHDVLEQKNIPYPYGLAIFCFVLGVKFVTLPLNWNQLSSSAALKSIKPQQDLVNKWYSDNKQLQNVETGNLFERQSVNPLAGCLPSLAQIPVFLGVYYSVTAISKAKIFDEGFLWIPSLSGPISDRTEGLSWLTEGWVNGAPKFGWYDTLCYLSIPAILVCTQTLSLYLLGSFEALGDKKESETTAFALRLLPLMIGWFAMNAPSGLGLYWVFNNVMTTTQTVAIKRYLEAKNPPIEISGLDDKLAALGPRREALPEVSTTAPSWVPQVTAAATTENAVMTGTAAESEAA